MKRIITAICVLGIGILTSCSGSTSTDSSPATNTSRIADHTVIHSLWQGRIPKGAITGAKNQLFIGYGHTSHGSQITDGLSGLAAFADTGNLGGAYTDSLLAVNASGADGALHLFEGSGYEEGWLQGDAGWSGNNLYDETKEFLDDASHGAYNVIMWSWCGQLSGYSDEDVRVGYLEPMARLEQEYGHVVFVYMTGHLDGTGTSGNLHQRNEQIRAYCRDNNKWLLDFADIESYDPDGNAVLAKAANDECWYDSDANNTRDRNWAQEWQSAHTQGVDWYQCGSAHSEPINANMKAYAAWWLFARIGGWDGTLNP